MQSENLKSIIDNLKKELDDKSRQLEAANERASYLQKQLEQNVNETAPKEVEFAEVWKENKILRRVIAKETEEVHSVYEKCVAVIQKYQELEAQYKQVLSILLNAEPATASQGLIVKLQKENEEYKASLEKMTAELEGYTEMKKQYKKVKEELDNLKSSNPELNDKAKLLEEIAQLKEDLAAKESNVSSLTKAVSDLKTKLEIGKYGVNDEAPQALDDFINQSKTEDSSAEELEAKYDAAKEERNLQIQAPSKTPLNLAEIVTEANTPREKALLLHIAELEAQLKELKDRSGLDIIPIKQKGNDKAWSIVPKDEKHAKVQNRSIILTNKEEEEEVDPHDLSNVNVSVIKSPKPEEQQKFVSDNDNLENESDLDSEYEALLSNENVANKKLITKLMGEVRKLRKELHHDQIERRELVETLRQSGSIMGSAPQSPKGQLQDEDYEIYTSNELETETDVERVNDRIQVVNRVVHLAEEEPQETETETETNREDEETSEAARETEPETEANENENEDEDKEAKELATLLDQPPADNLEEANSRIKQLEDKIKQLCDHINSLQFQESSLNISNDNQDFQAALKRISKLQKKLNDRSKPPENMQQFEDEISRLRTELQESSNHAKELQDLLDSFSKTTNSGVVEVVKENQNMKKMIERKDKEIEDATKKGADILSKYNEQQNTIKTLINELKAAKSKTNELLRTNTELTAQVEQLQLDLDQADADAESCKDDLSKLDEITGKYYLIQTELDTTKIKLDKAMMLLKTKGGPRAIYALEVYDNIVDYQAEIAAQKELLKNLESVLGLEQDSLLSLVDKDGQPRPIIENDQIKQNTETNEERNQQNIEKLRSVLHSNATNSRIPVEAHNLLLYESDNAFFKECDKLTDDYNNLTKETERMRTILSHIEEELHLEPGHLSNRQIDNELDIAEAQEDQKKKLPTGWLNRIVAENGGSGLFVKTRGVNLKHEEEEEEEESEKLKEMQRLNAESTNNQTKVLELEAICESLRRQINTLNNKLSLMDTDRLAALQTNEILSDKVKDLQRKNARLTNKLRAGNDNLNSSLNISVNEIKTE